MYNEFEIKEHICEVGRRIYNRGMVAANDGNISVKVGPNEFLCTPTGISKGFMTPDMICKVDGEGNVIEANGNYKPSSEIKMHLRVYKKRSDVFSVCHAHPIYATSYAIAGIELTEKIMPEAIIFLGEVPIAPYGLPSTPEIPDAVEPYLDCYDAVLLENHGALSWGQDVFSAYYKMESVEFYAQLAFNAKMLGGANEFSEYEVNRLYELRKAFNVPGRHPANGKVLPKAKPKTEEKNMEELIEDIVKKVIDSLKK